MLARSHARTHARTPVRFREACLHSGQRGDKGHSGLWLLRACILESNEVKPSQAAKKAGSTKEALGRAVTDGGREPRPAENAGKMEQTRNAGNAKKTESVGLEAGGPGEGAQVGHDMCRELDRLRAEVTMKSYVRMPY